MMMLHLPPHIHAHHIRNEHIFPFDSHINQIAHIFVYVVCVSYLFLFLAVMTECVDTDTGYAVDG